MYIYHINDEYATDLNVFPCSEKITFSISSNNSLYHFAWADQRKSRDATEMYPGKVMQIIGACLFDPNVLFMLSH